MLNLIKNFIKSKDGVGAIWATVVICLMMPIFLFGFIDVPYYMRMDRKMKNTVDDIAASAVTYLNENALREGIALLDETQARAYIMNELKIWYGVDCTGATNIPLTGTTSTAKKCSLIRESVIPVAPYVIEVKDDVGITDPTILNAPHIEIVIHKGLLEGNKYKLKKYKLAEASKTLDLRYPSVVVSVTTKVKGLMLHFPVKFMKTGYSQAGLSANAVNNNKNNISEDNGTSINLANIISSVNATVKNGYIFGFEKTSGNQYTITEILNMLQSKTDIVFKTSTGTSLGGGNLRTGATMNIKDTSSGKTITYTIIVFGDINGDGNITNSDAQAVQNYINGSSLNPTQKLAADVNHDGVINLDDLKAIQNHINGVSKIYQNY